MDLSFLMALDPRKVPSSCLVLFQRAYLEIDQEEVALVE
jgi:hypothetical protein